MKYKNEKIWEEYTRRLKKEEAKERKYRKEAEGLDNKELEAWCFRKDMMSSERYDFLAHEILDEYYIYTNKILEERRKELGECGKRS